ncbi:MAG: hypothetical protein CM15mP107_1740 [Bacteroidota bacterium]|nr:MAG: hypothetical protein CM15mP107_1740 [Bacteroidota bacterium]
MQLNHSFGENPQVQMYFNASEGEWGQPSAENPWFNEIPKHMILMLDMIIIMSLLIQKHFVKEY